MEGATNTASGPAGRSPEGRGGGRASAALPLLDDVTTSPASRRLASARPALAPKCTPYFLTGPKLAAAFVGLELLRLRKGASKLWTSAAAPDPAYQAHRHGVACREIRLGRRPGHFLVFGPQGGHGWYLDDTECLDFPQSSECLSRFLDVGLPVDRRLKPLMSHRRW